MKFVAPELEIKRFSTEEILTESSEDIIYTGQPSGLPSDDFE